MTYQRLCWPVTLHRDQVTLKLELDVDAVALVIPAVLAITRALTQLER